MSHDEISKAAWRKASFCNGATACVEVAPLPGGGVAVRDSKQEDGPVLTFTRAEWAVFIAGVQDNQFDLSALSAGVGWGVDGRARGCDAPVARVGPSQVSV